MKQLLLDLGPDRPPTLENFVPGDNIELLADIALFAAGRPPLPGAHFYLWGAPGSGRSHLLQAAAARAREHGRPAFSIAAAEAAGNLPADKNALLAIDDIEQLSPPAQIALFNAFNRARGNGQSLLLAGPAAPRELGPALREDLRTRIGQSLIFEVRPLDDTARTAILHALAARRGLRLADDVVGFMLNHGRRDLPSMAAALGALDTASLEHKRPITLPLLRQLIQQGLRL
ncbi:MAG: DnaA regulatory inactivator Hda [Azoarcus sp.]|jgi:DnaA family protein|nr:DnaA regulatory inactivator Hda [Azoarcus sp.]